MPVFTKRLSMYQIGLTLVMLVSLIYMMQAKPAYAGATPVAGDIIFNEFAADNDANTNDFFELLVLTDNLDLRGLRVSDNEVTGVTLNNNESVFIFGTEAYLDNVPKGTIIAVWPLTAGVTTDTSTNPAASDWKMVLAPGTGVTTSVDGLGGSLNTGLSTSGEALYLYLPGPDGNSAGTDNIYLDYISSESGGNAPTGLATTNLSSPADNAYYTGNTAAGNDDTANWVKSADLGSETPGEPNPTQDLSALRVTSTGDAPTIEEAATTTVHLDLSTAGPGIVSGVISDPTDPAATLGIDFVIGDTDTDVANLTVTAASNNQAVVPDANLNLTGSGANRNLKITPTGVGVATITVTVTDPETNSATYTINYAASAASVVPATSRFHTGKSDASAAIALDSDYMLVGDDEDETIRLYDRNNSGLPVATFNFNGNLALSGTEADIEGATRVGNRLYWIGSHSNSSGGNDRPDRERIFSTDLSGTGAATTLSFVNFYPFLADDLIAWDDGNGHGLGAGFFGLAASAADGVIPEQSNGFSIEGLSMAPGSSTTAYIAFRAPIVPATARTKALIVPVTNFTTIVDSGASSGSAAFGTPIQLNLAGRGIRSIECNANGCVLIGGAADGSGNFALYTWSGNAGDAPELRAADLAALGTGGSFESFAELPAGNFMGANGDASTIQLLTDNGDTVWYGNGTISKDLAEINQQKFRSDILALGAVTSDNVAPIISSLSPADDATDVAIGANLVATFNENVQLGTGTITLKKSDGTVVEPFDVATASQVTVNGAAVTIDPSAALEQSSSYYVEIAAGAIQDLAGNAFAGIADNSTWNFATAAPALYDLQVTEIWVGQDGADLTADWFEILNQGTEPWVAASDPTLYYDDDSAAAADADPIQGLTQIDPGKRVIVLITANAGDTTTFFNVWNPDTDLSGVEIGYTDGAGLGDSGDAVTLWVGNPTVSGALVDNEAVPTAPSGLSYDVELAAFSTVGNASGAVATTATAGTSGTESAIGSPGNTPYPPTPTDILNEPFDYAELNQAAAFSLSDTNGNPISFFGEATSFDYFGIFDGNSDGGADFGGDSQPTGFNAYTGFDDNYLGGSDIDGGTVAIADPAYLTWSGLNIAGQSNLVFLADLATLDTDEGLDADDFAKFEYRIDGGAWQNLLAFETIDTTSFNQTTFFEDTNFDGIGDGAALSAAAKTFAKFLTVSGTTLDLRLGIRVEAGFEDIGIDTILLTDADNVPFGIVALNPADDATNVAVNTNLAVTFNRSVQKGTGNIVIKQGVDNTTVETIAVTSGQVTVSGNVVTIDPTNDLAANTAYYVQIDSGAIAETTGDPFGGISDTTTWNFTTQAAASVCSDPATLISAIQGSGTASPLVGNQVTIEGIVVGDFQGGTKLRGFFVQEEDSDVDANPATSEGIVVFEGSTPILDVAVGDIVRVQGTVVEFNTLTELSSVSDILLCSSSNPVPAPAQVTLPESTDGELEQYEGMYVQITDASDMIVAQNYFVGRYGQLTLAAGQRLYQPTNQELPGSAAAIALAAENAKRLLILDDGQDISSLGDNPNPVPYIGPPPPAVLRAGDEVSNLIGVIDFGRINSAPEPDTGRDYRLQPTVAPVFTAQNLRQNTPDAVGGTLKVAAFNVLNYFNGNGSGGGFPTSRGAATASEFTRQRDKVIAALAAIDGDVVGLLEIENDGYGVNSAIQDLVNGLNATLGAGTYAFIDPGVSVIGTDEIAVALIYKPSTVTPIGAAAILDSSVDPNFIDTKNRPALAQTFQQNSNGEKFTVSVNHLKSKGSDCNDVSDPDTGDGQGNCNLTRTKAANALADWLASDPTGSGDPDFMIIGDLNSYAKEDPIAALESKGYTDLINQFIGDTAYSYTFDGLLGYLDHALATASLTAKVTGVTEWHINTDEPEVINYDEEFNPAGYYAANPFRASDHDPVIVGLNLAVQLNSSVTQQGATTANNPTPQLCAATGTNLAIYTVTSTMQNVSANSFTDLYFRVKTLEYTADQGGQQPSLCNATTVVNNGGVGSTVVIPNSSLPGGDNQLNPGDNLVQPFAVGRPVAAQFRIKVDLFSSAVAAAGATDELAGNGYLGSFEYVFDPMTEPFTAMQEIFLPLIVR